MEPRRRSNAPRALHPVAADDTPAHHPQSAALVTTGLRGGGGGGGSGDFDDEEGSGPDFSVLIKRILIFVWLRRWWIPLGAILGLIGGLLFAISKPVEFKSSGQMVWLGGIESLDVDSFSEESGRRGGLVETAPYLFRSQEVCQRVLERMTPAEILADEAFNSEYEPTGTAPMDEARRWLRALRRQLTTRSESPRESDALSWMLGGSPSHLQIVSPRRSNIVLINYTAKDPVAARDTLHAFMEEALSFHLQVYGDKEEIALIEKNARESETRLRAAQTALDDLQDRLGVEDLETSIDDEIEALRFAERNLDQARSQQAAANDQIERNQELIKTVAKYRPVADDRLLAIEVQLIDKQGELKTRRQLVLDENDEKIMTLTTQVADLKERLKERRTELEQDPELTRQPNEVWFTMNSQLDSAKFELEQSDKRIQQLEPEISRTKKRIQELRSHRREYSSIVRELEIASASTERERDRLRKARDKQAYSDTGISALRPSQPTIGVRVSATPTKFGILGLVGGAAMTIGLLAGLGFIDRRLRLAADLQFAGVPVLAVFPSPGRKQVRKHIRVRQLRC